VKIVACNGLDIVSWLEFQHELNLDLDFNLSLSLELDLWTWSLGLNLILVYLERNAKLRFFDIPWINARVFEFLLPTYKFAISTLVYPSFVYWANLLDFIYIVPFGWFANHHQNIGSTAIRRIGHSVIREERR